MWWLLPSGGVGAAVYVLLGVLSDGEPLWLRIIWGLTAAGAVMLLSRQQ